jgi:hypothetical protein
MPSFLSIPFQILIYYGLTSRGEMVAMTFGHACNQDFHAKPDYNTDGHARVETRGHYRSGAFILHRAISGSRAPYATLLSLSREDEADIAEQ